MADNDRITAALLRGDPATPLEDRVLPTGEARHYEVRFGLAAVSRRMPQPPTSGMLEMCLETGTARIVELAEGDEANRGLHAVDDDDHDDDAALAIMAQEVSMEAEKGNAKDEAKDAQVEADDALWIGLCQNELCRTISCGLQRGKDVQAVLNYTDARVGVSGHPVPVEVTVRDARPAIEANQLNLFDNGFMLVKQRTSLRTEGFYRMGQNKRLELKYFEEMEHVIKAVTGAHRVVVMNYLVRNGKKADKRGMENPFQGGGNGINGYVAVVHTDYCAKKSVDKVYKNGGVSEHLQGRYMLINGWRNISEQHPIYNNTLACCDARSVNAPADLLRIEVPLSADSTAEQYRLTDVSVPHHRWYYFPNMRKDELLLFTQYDSNLNAPARFCFHTSFTDLSVPTSTPLRESVEIRAIAFFPTEHQAMAGLRATLAVLRPDDLIEAFAQGASHGHLDPSEIDDIVDSAVYAGTNKDAIIADFCERRGVCYIPNEWIPGAAAERVLDKLTQIREARQSGQLVVSGKFGVKTCKALQAMLVRSGSVDFGPIDGNFTLSTQHAMKTFLEEKGYDVDWSDSGFGERSIRAMHEWTHDSGFPTKSLTGIHIPSLQAPEAHFAVCGLQKTLNALALADIAKAQSARPLQGLLDSPVPAAPPSRLEEVKAQGTFTTPGPLGFELVEMQVGSELIIKVTSITAGGAGARAILGLAVGMRLVTVNHEHIEAIPYNEVFQMFFARPLHLGFTKSTSLSEV